jgi:hypothetical protein
MMGVSIFLSRVFGLYLVIVCLAVLFRYKMFRAVYDEMVSSKGHVVFGGFLSLVIGILVVVSHSVFVWDWRLLITLLGYLALIKGIWLLFFPESALKFKRSVMENKSAYYIIVVIFLLIGLFFIYKGFFCGMY